MMVDDKWDVYIIVINVSGRKAPVLVSKSTAYVSTLSERTKQWLRA